MEPANVLLRMWYRSLTPDQREFFDERAGIIEHDAGLNREQAEDQAAEQTATFFNLPKPGMR